MIRRLALALLVAAAPGLAQAGDPIAFIAPTAPAADNGDRIANTAWVRSFVAAGLPLGAGQIFIGNASNLATAQTPSGDWTISQAGVATLASTIAAGGPTGSATVAPIITYDVKGRLTAVSSATITPAVGSITGLGTGVAAAMAVNVGSAGAFVTFNGALGTPSSGTLTNATGCPVGTCISGLAANIAAWLATPSSANLRAALTDESGTGAAYFQGGDLGTPSAGVLTNATGLPIGSTINTLALNRGGTGQTTQQAAFNALAPTATVAGSINYWNGTNWVKLDGNAVGTKILQEDASGVPSWVAAGTGTVTSVATGNGLSGGTITTTGTLTIDTTAMTTFTPTIACSAGGSSTVTSANGRTKQWGKIVFIQFKVVISATTCAGVMTATINGFTAGSTDYTLSGRETTATGTMWTGTLLSGGTTVAFQKYDGSGAVAGTFVLTGWFETN